MRARKPRVMADILFLTASVDEPIAAAGIVRVATAIFPLGSQRGVTGGGLAALSWFRRRFRPVRHGESAARKPEVSSR